MVQLELVVNVFTCKKGPLFPENESDWTAPELIKILSLSGVVGKLHSNHSYADIVNLLLDRLNIQQPLVYAVIVHDRESSLLLNSQTVQIEKDKLRIGPFAVLHPLHTHDSCEALWKVFITHVASGKDVSRRAVDRSNPIDQLDHRDLQILELKRKIANLEKAAPLTENGRLRQQLNESMRLLQNHQAKVEEKQAHDNQLQDKNQTLVQDYQRMEANVLLLRQEIEKWKGSREELEAVKQQLKACRSNQQ